MIAKEFERFLLAQEETFLTPAKNLDRRRCKKRGRGHRLRLQFDRSPAQVGG